MGLDISVESRSGDTSSDRKARQRAKPPNILLTTPESLSLLLSWPDSFAMFADLKTVVIDEIHAFAPGKRGDLLALSFDDPQDEAYVDALPQYVADMHIARLSPRTASIS